MAKEIERKYLLKNDNWRKEAQPVYYKQGYLSYGQGNTVRIRIAGNEAWVTIKSATVGISRSEFEYLIPIADANSILDDICFKPLIEKYRSKIKYKGMIWEVDEFLGENKGLIIAEVELENENQQVEIPEWIGEEVSSDKRYYNSYLVKNPYKNWR